MRNTRKLLTVIISIIMVLSIITIPASAYYRVTMYAPDGRTISVEKSSVQSWKNVGWYEYPVVTMYAPDGRTLVVYKSDVPAWESVGWYDGSKTTTIYALDGRTANIPAYQLQAYLNLGWYAYPVANNTTQSSTSYSNGIAYYPGTQIPTFESVTGVPLERVPDYGNGPFYVYPYTSSYWDSDDVYFNYLESIGFDLDDIDSELKYWSSRNELYTEFYRSYKKGSSRVSIYFSVKGPRNVTIFPY